MISPPHLWIVDDDAAVRTAVRALLTIAGGHRVKECGDGTEALARWRAEAPQLIILDVDMPKLNGWRTLEGLRREGYTGPILMMTQIADIPSRVRGLEEGADDYLPKPFAPEELLARVKALLRRSTPAPPDVSGEATPALHLGEVTIDFEGKSATKSGTALHLTRTDFALLKLLADHRGRPVARATILREVWEGQANSSHALDTHLWRLRKKLGDGEAAGRQWLRNLPGIGYVMATEDQAAGE